MRARCRCPHVTHYSLSRLINEIKKRLSHCFWELLQGLIGGGECLHRPPSNALSLTKRSDHGKRLPELRVRLSFLAFIHPLEPLLQWKRRRENEGEERERDALQRLLQYDISHRDPPQQPLAFKLLFKQSDRVPNSMAVVSGGWCACWNLYHRQLRSRHIRLTLKMQHKQSYNIEAQTHAHTRFIWQVHTVWKLHTTLALRHLVNTQSFCTGS